MAVEASDGCVVAVVLGVLEGAADVEPAFEFGPFVSGADLSKAVSEPDYSVRDRDGNQRRE